MKPVTPAESDQEHPPQLNELPNWITDELLETTRLVWQPYYSEELSRDELGKLCLAVGQLLQVLNQKPDP